MIHLFAMQKLNRKKVLIPGLIYSTLLFLFSLINIGYIYADGAKGIAGDAESYRTKGYEAQEKGDIDSAIEWFQKAVNLDPSYAAPHNDLGILFETKGWLDRAESEYQKALAIDSNYKEVYTNLALLYERKGELEKAAFHWMKRYKLGKPEEPWTQEAKARLEKLGLLEKAVQETAKTAAEPTRQTADKQITSRKEAPAAAVRPEVKKPEHKKGGKEKVAKKEKPVKKKTSGWTRIGSAEAKKKALKPTPKSKKKAIDKELEESLRLAEERLKRERSAQKPAAPGPKPETTRPASDTGSGVPYSKARDYYNKGEYSKALDVIRSAKKDYPDNAQLLGLEDDIKNKMKEERIQDHYSEGMIHYRQKDYTGAKKEFEAILSILPE